MLSFAIENGKMRDLLRLYSEAAKRSIFLQDLSSEAKAYMHRQAMISIVGSSTRIENAVLTNTEVDWMDDLMSTDAKPTSFDHLKDQIQNKLGKDKQRSIEEVAGCRDILSHIYTQKPEPTEFLIRSLHHELMRHDSRSGLVKGDYKKHSNSVMMHNRITGEKISVFKTADAGVETNTAMKDLFEWYPKAIQAEPHPLMVIVEFIYRFLAIHPFQDGNGRMGRALFILLLLRDANAQFNELVPYLAIDRHIEKHKQAYYATLAMTSKGQYKRDLSEYKIHFFFDYMLKIITDSLDDLPFYAEKFKAYKKLTPAMRQVLDGFKQHPELHLQTKDLIKHIDMPRKTIVYCLGELTKRGFLYRRGQKAGTHYELIF